MRRSRAPIIEPSPQLDCQLRTIFRGPSLRHHHDDSFNEVIHTTDYILHVCSHFRPLDVDFICSGSANLKARTQSPFCLPVRSHRPGEERQLWLDGPLCCISNRKPSKRCATSDKFHVATYWSMAILLWPMFARLSCTRSILHHQRQHSFCASPGCNVERRLAEGVYTRLCTCFQQSLGCVPVLAGSGVVKSSHAVLSRAFNMDFGICVI